MRDSECLCCGRALREPDEQDPGISLACVMDAESEAAQHEATEPGGKQGHPHVVLHGPKIVHRHVRIDLPDDVPDPGEHRLFDPQHKLTEDYITGRIG